MIGGLFLIYGVILLVLGIGASDAEIDKAAGWNLNLWVGVALLGGSETARRRARRDRD